MSNPIAVLISDVHYSLPTLHLADESMRQAISKANELNLPLIVAGDLHDTKANLRGECVNAMIETFKMADQSPIVLIGNHDKINEKSEDHSLNFLSKYCMLLSKAKPICLDEKDASFLIPYQHDLLWLRGYLETIPKGSTVIMHQGLKTSNAGDYIQDHTALSPEDVAGLRVISGHYHTRQTIPLPDGGQWDFIGNPYTLTYGEANDPRKGYQILLDDGSLNFTAINLRSHIVISTNHNFDVHHKFDLQDLVWVKVHGTHEELATITREKVKSKLGLEHFKLDLIPTNTEAVLQPQKKTNAETMDALIDGLDSSLEQKKRLKGLWRGL